MQRKDILMAPNFEKSGPGIESSSSIWRTASCMSLSSLSRHNRWISQPAGLFSSSGAAANETHQNILERKDQEQSMIMSGRTALVRVRERVHVVHVGVLGLLFLAFSWREANAWVGPAASFVSRAGGPDLNAFPSPSSLRSLPTLDEWEVMDDGTVVGTVSNHPAIEDGDVIATSPLTDPTSAAALAVVTTLSGSKYKLGIPSPSKERNGSTLNHSAIGTPAPSRRSTPSIAINPQKALMDVHKRADLQYQMIVQSFMGGGLKPAPRESPPQDQEQDLMEAQRVAKLMYEKALKEARRAAVLKYDLTREKVGEYLLSGKPIKSTSGKSQIWTAYKENEDGLPTGDPVIVKVSPIVEALEREHANYKKATSGYNTGQFVQFHHFLPRAGESKQLYNQCALIMEKGSQDLKNYLSFQEGMRLQGAALRDAAMAAAKCLQAFHSSNLVWTDLKAENFVVMQNDYSQNGGDNAKLHVKGIDLESAMPYRDNPVDYSPESCPPEFASAFLKGNGPFFQLDFSYDIWSYGIFLYELATGEGAFDGKTPAQVTKTLSEPDHEINVMKVEDPRLRNLIKSCLRKDPQRRPPIHMIMMHSYFLASYNPFQPF
jgi:hypothetical protein